MHGLVLILVLLTPIPVLAARIVSFIKLNRQIRISVTIFVCASVIRVKKSARWENMICSVRFGLVLDAHYLSLGCGEKYFLICDITGTFALFANWHRAHPFSHMRTFLGPIVYLNESEFSTTLNNLQKNVNGWFDIHSSCIATKIATKCARKETAMQIIMNEKRWDEPTKKAPTIQWTTMNVLHAHRHWKKPVSVVVYRRTEGTFTNDANAKCALILIAFGTHRASDGSAWAALSNWPLRRLTFPETHKNAVSLLCAQRNRKSRRVSCCHSG